MKSASVAWSLLIVISLVFILAIPASSVVINHETADIWQIPETAILQAKAELHIAYGHTSHGSQLISGMGSSGGSQLDQFMTNNGATPDLYRWNSGGTSGALDLRDNPFSGASDLGNPNRTAWATASRNYLDSHADCNVIIWSWCGQASTSIENIDIYLDLMEGLIADYPGVHFVFMTGHLDGGGEDGILNLANEHIRNHCITYDRILYDFADIESYDPDHQMFYMPLLCNDGCYYDSDDSGSRDANWALDWQSSHVEGVDWWPSGASHSQHLNGNLKGYAAWWLWATLAGWGQCIEAPTELVADADPVAQEIELSWTDNSSDPDEDSFIIQRQVDGGVWDNDYATVTTDVTSFTDSALPVGAYSYRVIAHLDDDGSGSPCNSSRSNIASADMVDASAPLAPTALTATPNSAGRYVTLIWVDNANNEDGYIVQRRIGSGAWDDAYDESLPANSTTYTDDELLPGSYTYRVVADNEWGLSSASNEDEAIVLDIPLAPSDLTAVGNSTAGEVTLSWLDNSSSEEEFVIQRQVNGGAWDGAYDTVGSNIETYLDDNHGGSLPNGTYTYRLVAANINGVSAPSNEATAVISLASPNAPGNLTFELNGFDITLNWVDESDNEETFILERAVDEGDFTELAILPVDTETYLDGNMPPLHTYYYRVKAHNNFGDSDYSNQVTVFIAEETFSITLKQSVDGYSGCRDAYLDAANPTYNYGGDMYNYVESDPQCSFLVSFELPEELAGKVIIEAKLGFYVWTISGYQDDQYLDLYRVTEPWAEGTVDGSYQAGSASWEIRSGDGEEDIPWTTPGGTYAPEIVDSSLIPSAAYYPEFDVAGLVQEWANNVTPNLGVILKNDSATRTGIKASEYSEYGRPYLEIIYSVPSSDVEVPIDIARSWQLLPNYPNPCLSSTTLRFHLAEAQSDLELSVYSIDGRCVATLKQGVVGAGLHEVNWHGLDRDGSALESGVYFARLRSGSAFQTRKIMLAR